MKIKKKFIAIILFSTFGYSCNYLDVVPDNVATLDHAFSDRFTAETFLSNCYWYLPTSANPNASPAYMGSGEFMHHRAMLQTSMLIARGSQTAATHQLNMWGGGNGGKKLWDGINNCNIFLDNIQKVQDLTPVEMRRWIAEVKFLKAYYHFFLLRYYGPIHILDASSDVSKDTELIRQERLTVDECFEYILGLLDEIIEEKSLPNTISNPREQLGRITQSVALAVKAKILTTWASPLFNGNTDYANFKDAQGRNFFNQQHNPELWTRAAEACKVAIDECHLSGHALFTTNDLKVNFDLSNDGKIQMAYRSGISERWNPEVIWGNTQSLLDVGYQALMIPHLRQVNYSVTSGWYSPTINVAELYYTENGVPINEDNTGVFNYADRYERRVNSSNWKTYNIEAGGETARLNYNRENRFYASLGFDRGKWYNFVGHDGWERSDGNAPTIRARFNEYSSMYNPNNYSTTGYFPKKLVSVNSGFSEHHRFTGEDYPFPEMRMADLYLLYAEALNESNSSPDSEVYRWIDLVRHRAGLKGVQESWANYSSNPNKPSTKQGMREIIQHERNIELALESENFWDARRWKTAIRDYNRSIKGWNVLRQDVIEYYELQTIFNQKFSHKDYFAPIPEFEIIKNPKLVQNPGW
jgi:hypothetical protein